MPTASASSKVDPILPQEIVDLVVDEIARQKPDSQSLATLLACRLVCKSFAASSRQHIFSNLAFYLDDAYMKRISRLINILEDRNNSHLVGSIRSLKVIVCLPHDQSEFQSQYHTRLLKPPLKERLAKAFGRRQHDQNTHLGARVRGLIERANIHNFTLQFKGKNLQWPRGDLEKRGGVWRVFSIVDSAALHIFPNTSLTSASFINISDVPGAIIVTALLKPNMEEIILRNCQWYTAPYSMPLFTSKLSTPLPKLKKLEIRKTGLLFLAAIITDPINMPELRVNLTSTTPTIPNVAFTHLRTLVATIPEDPIRLGNSIQLELFCTFLLGVSRTLEVLELETLKLNFNARRWSGRHPDYVQLIRLDRLVALRSLKLSAKSFTGPQINIDWSLQIFSILLEVLSPVTPLSIKSIELELVIPAMRSATDMSPVNPIRTDYWRDPSHWSEVDQKLVGPCFPDLQYIHLSARVSPNDISTKMDAKEDSRPYAASVLPKVAASPVIVGVHNSRDV